MKYFLPIIIILGILIASCNKDKDIPNEISQKDKSIADSLYSIYGVKFTKPSELKITSGHTTNFVEGSTSIFLGFRNGDPWIAVYSNKKLLVENSEVLPDSIKADKLLDRVQGFSPYFSKDGNILLSGIIRHGFEPSVPVEKIAPFMYYYNSKDNSIKRKIYDYGYLSEIALYDRIREWYDGSFLMNNWGGDKYCIIGKDLEELHRYSGVISSTPAEDTYYFPDYIRGLYVTSMNEYFTMKIVETALEISKWSTSSILISPKYPELPYYSYLKVVDKVEIIERPGNYVRLEDPVSSIEDLGNELEVTLSGTMLLSDEKNQKYYEKEIKGRVLVDKKTGNVVNK